MKKITFIIALVLTSGLICRAQTAPTKSANEKVEAASAETEREKFDPARDPKIDLQTAIANAQVDGKRIILDVGGEWCGWCRYMDKFFSQNPRLAKIRAENFVWLKVNFSDENENKEFLASYPAIKGYPHLFVLEKDGTLLHSQDTAALEGEKSYNLQIFTEFLKKWSPAKESSGK